MNRQAVFARIFHLNLDKIRDEPCFLRAKKRKMFQIKKTALSSRAVEYPEHTYKRTLLISL